MSALQTQTVAQEEVVFLAMEMSNCKWRLVFSAKGKGNRHVVIEAGDWFALSEQCMKARAKFEVDEKARILSVYEAGRDGFWPHRRLLSLGIENRVIDSASIEVNRKARQVKTDRVDGEKLMELLQSDYFGQKRLRVVRVPSEEEEDRRHLHRERERLQKERRSLVNRIHAVLALHGLKVRCRTDGRGWQKELATLQTHLPPNRQRDLQRARERLGLIEEQLAQVDAQRGQALAEERSAVLEKVRQLILLRGLGEQSAWLFVMECFGWRRFSNRRELAASVGLTGTAYDSGESRREQGISKAGNHRMRHMLIEIAWLWLRYQPDSALTRWFVERFGGGGKRMQRVGIVALARRLLIALWRYLEHGEWPVGARAKAV